VKVLLCGLSFSGVVEVLWRGGGELIVGALGLAGSSWNL
jgi:hypothetical protein